MLGSYRGHDNKVRMARCLLWHHLNASGMTFDEMGPIFKTSPTHVAFRARQGMIGKTEEEAKLLMTIPINLKAKNLKALRA
jgi:hypothetical protein